MGLLRLATDETKQLPLGDDPADYIEVKKDISKRDYNTVVNSLPESAAGSANLTIPEAMGFQEFLFKFFVKGWSLDVEPTVENYLGLTSAASNAVDEALAKHFQSLTPGSDESTKS